MTVHSHETAPAHGRTPASQGPAHEHERWRSPGPSRLALAVSTVGRHAGNLAAVRMVQRSVVASQRAWLQTLLTTPDESVTDGSARRRLLQMDREDRLDTINALRANVPAFVSSVSSNLHNSVEAARLVAMLESAQPNDAYADRLVDLLNGSDPVLGFAAVLDVPESRVRAMLQGHPQASAALTHALSEVSLMACPTHLIMTRSRLEVLDEELAAPDTAGVEDSTFLREMFVEMALTPESVRQARREARASNRPDPTFEETGYYDDLMTALHGEIEGMYQRSADIADNPSMDTSAGGHVEGMAQEAKDRVDAIFGIFGSASAPQLSFATGNLRDQTQTSGDPFDLARWVIEDSGRSSIQQVKEDHHAFASDRANQIGREVAAHYSNTRARGIRAAPRDLDTRIGRPASEREDRLRLIDRMWPGMAGGGRVSIRAREGEDPHETRRLYWGLFKTLIHEYLHTTAHADYTTWYEGLTDQHQVITYQEGFTDLFTRMTWRSVWPDHISSSPQFRRKIQGSDVRDMEAVGDDPAHYPQMEQAEEMVNIIGLPNMKAAYFRGDTDRLSGGNLPRSSP